VLVIPVVAALIVTGGVIAPKSDGPSTAPATAGGSRSAPPASVARARGGPGPDVLRGGPKANRLFGRGGADRLYGRRGNDWLSGGPGKDHLVGGRGRDHLLGGPGPDLIRADGRDRVRAGSGNDVVVVRAGKMAFTVSCGRGHDTLIVVRAKRPTKRAVRRRASGCEKIVRRQSLPPSTGAPGAPQGPGGTGPTSTQGGVVPESPLPPPSVFVSTTGSDGGPCSATAPCQSFDRAYHVAAPGQVVQVAAGSYPEQIMNADSSHGSGGNVTFVPAPGAAVSVNWIRLGRNYVDQSPGNIEFRRINGDGFISRRGSGISFVNSSMETFNVDGTSNVSIRGGSVGPLVGENPAIATWKGDPQDVVPTNILIDRVLFHDMVMKTPTDHMECLHIMDATNLTIRNSHFARCDTFGLNVGIDKYGLHNVLIENNVIETSRSRFGTQAYYSLSLRLGTGIAIRNNSFAQDWAGPSDSDSIGTWRVVGNAGGGSPCDDRVTYSHNVWDDWKCSSTDREADPRFVNRNAGDLRLVAGSPAINAGDPADHPATDIMGKARDSAPDAGAYER
jgi:RTX calcium-binding nonapeptide repeat (4 copies)